MISILGQRDMETCEVTSRIGGQIRRVLFCMGNMGDMETEVDMEEDICLWDLALMQRRLI